MERLRYDNAREWATAMGLVRVPGLSGSIEDGAMPNRSARTPALSARLQSAVAGPRAALRLRVLLFQRAGLYPNQPDAAAGDRPGLCRFGTRRWPGARSEHGPGRRSGRWR